MICLTCRDFHRVYPGQTPPPHDCFFGDPIEQLHVLTHTTSELRHMVHALFIYAQDDRIDEETCEKAMQAHHRLLGALAGVEA